MNKRIKTAALAGLSALALASCSSTNKVTKDSDNATRPDNAYMDIDSKFLTFSNDQRATINNVSYTHLTPPTILRMPHMRIPASFQPQ